MPSRVLLRVVVAAEIALFVTALVSGAASAPAQAPRTVLTIHWGPEDFTGASSTDAAIRKVLLSDDSAPVDYFAEYLESETFPPERASLALRDYIREKFGGRRIDVILANTTPALRFVLSYRDELFAGVPIVYVAGPLDATFRTVPLATGLISDVTFGETMELALKLHPSVRRVFVVARTANPEGYTERVRTALQRFTSQVEITYISETSLAGLLAAVKAIPAGSLILYTRYQPDQGEGVLYTDEIARAMAEVSPVPIYGTSDLYVGTGVVGGMVRSARNGGTRLGEIARQILNGARPEDIPVATVQLTPMFDWRQLRRWNVDMSRLPPGSDIEFRTPTAWESYRRYIIGTIVVVIAQLVLIVGLLTQRARRRRAEETIRANEATLRASYDRIRQLAGRLINAQEAARASIARDLHDDVAQRLAYVSLAANILKKSSGRIEDAQTQQAFSELEHDTLGVLDGIRRLSHDLHPATLRLLGLAPALSSHSAELEKRHKVEVKFTAHADLGYLHPDVAICFFRIAQESLRNGLVHGEARHFVVSLTRSGTQIEMTVTDDGVGFDLEAVRRDGSGLGLVSMEERARVVGANVQIVSAPGQGTTIRVRGPAELPQPARMSDPRQRSEETQGEPALG